MHKFICILVLFSSTLALGQSSFFNHEPDDYEFYLHTFDPGDLIYTNFGHTAIRVKNTKNHEDFIFNWGIFDFNDPLTFSLNYYKGNLIYKLGVFPTRRALQYYKFENRKIWQDKINFTIPQKRIMLASLEENALPQNRSYKYDYFFDNCATRPRDFFDKALGGILFNSTKEQNLSLTFRDTVRQGYNVNPWMDVILEVGMNSRIDRQMSRWESMFHPIYLRDELKNLNNEGRPLIEETQILFDLPSLEPMSFDIFKVLAFIFGLMVVVALISLQYEAYQRSKTQNQDEPHHLNLRLLGFAGSLFFLIGGIFGFLMPLNWLFSGHLDLHHNINMMLFFPLDIFLLYIFGFLLFKGKRRVFKQPIFKYIKKYFLFHILLTTALAVSWAMGDVKQSLDRVIYLAPICILLLGLATNFGIKEELP